MRFIFIRDIDKNVLLPNIGTFRNKGDDNVHFEKTLYMASTTSHIVKLHLAIVPTG